MAYNNSALRGHAQAGDPFLGKIIKGIGSVVGTVAGVAGGILPGPLGGIARTAGTLLTGGPRRPAPFIQPPSVPGVGRGFGGLGGVGAARRAGAAYGAGLTGAPRRRRMNPLNVKALRRSTRRLASFQREAKKVEKQLRKLAPPRRTSSRRDLGPRHTHVR